MMFQDSGKDGGWEMVSGEGSRGPGYVCDAERVKIHSEKLIIVSLL